MQSSYDAILIPKDCKIILSNNSEIKAKNICIKTG